MKTPMLNFLVVTVAFLSLSSCGVDKSEVKERQKPNIIFIMADDHTSQAIGAYGSRLAKLNPTPTIDRLAKEGILFENAFCTNAICTPSRASIITGQYSQANGVLDLDGNLPADRQYLPIEMNKLGYQTAVMGKWHLKDAPEAFGYYKVFYNQGEYFNPVMREKGALDSVSNYKLYKKTGTFPGKRYEGHSSDVVTDASLNWLKNIRDKSKPFMLLHHFKAPHDMFEFAPRYKDYLEDVTIPEPASLWDNQNNGSIATKGINGSLMDTIGSSVGKRNVIRNMGQHMEIDPNLSDDEYKRQAYQEYLKRYLRCVKGVDDNVKRLFDYLEKEGLMDNTIIMYTGDQGFMLGEHDYIDKRWMYEEAMRMPFLVRYPKMIKAGTRTDAIVNNTDYAPTIIELAGGKTPSYMQGNSFSELLETGKEPESWQQSTYYRYWMHMAHKHNNPAHFGIRTKKYKLIFFYGEPYRDDLVHWKGKKKRPLFAMNTPAAWEFYDLEKDPKEMDNKYNDPAYAEIIQQLKKDLKEKRKSLNEEDAKYPNIQKVIEDNWDK
ncbi:sulfatase [Polaribacter sp. Z014]|uniref:sulfatase family protein n=1 Tax=Polaribacter sp. Z014 TaxID=2927126 RepID=UPI00202180D2|nr:sulfatase [Polaribacter sp. Z014]MCL7763994.1 sulfatase [Polaribacter sp. Z014]